MAVISGKQMYKKGEQIRKNVWEHGNIGNLGREQGSKDSPPHLPPTGRPKVKV